MSLRPCSESDAFEEGEGFAELREECLIGFEFAGVDAAAQAAHLHGMLEMKHLVVADIRLRTGGLEGRSKTRLTTIVLWAGS